MSALSILEPAPADVGCCADETWKPIPGWPHEASTCGRGRSVTRIDASGRLRLGQVLPQYTDDRPGKGYVYWVLVDGKRRRKVHVAVAVLEAHDKPRPAPGYDACHDNHARTDNHLLNVFWDTHAANVAASVLRRLAAVTEAAALSREPRSPWWRRDGAQSQPLCHSARDFGTGSSRIPFSFLSHFLSLNPVPWSLRSRRTPR